MSKKTKKDGPKVKKRPSVLRKEKFKKEQAKHLESVLDKLRSRNLFPKKNRRWRNFRTTVILLFIIGFSVLGVYMSANLDYFINERMEPTLRYGLLMMFAIFMQVISLVIWDDLFEKVDDDYFFKPLLYIGFWGFLISGVLTFVIFAVFAVGQWLWWSPTNYFGVLPVIFGALLLASFVYRAVNFLGED